MIFIASPQQGEPAAADAYAAKCAARVKKQPVLYLGAAAAAADAGRAAAVPSAGFKNLMEKCERLRGRWGGGGVGGG
jgi:hypothetical protein